MKRGTTPVLRLGHTLDLASVERIDFLFKQERSEEAPALLIKTYLPQGGQVAEENGILRLSLNCYDFESDKFPTVLAAKGIYDSDLLILDTAGMELYLNGGNALELTSKVLAQMGVTGEVRLQYLHDRPRALLIYDADDPAYNAQFDLSFLKLSMDDGSSQTDFYLIINGKTIHASPFAQGQTDAVIDLCKEIFH